jgi:hypothetical protein
VDHGLLTEREDFVFNPGGQLMAGELRSPRMASGGSSP